MRARTIPKGRPVLAATRSAMFDSAKIFAPQEFRSDRPDDNYLHFGFGPHTCFGRYINMVQVPGILKPVLRLAGLRRAPGPAGALAMAGPFPSSMTVEFDSALRPRS
jgi:cytochrome P450